MTHFAVDAGGSRTRVLVARSGGERVEWELGSVNRHATGQAADHTLDELFTSLRATAPTIGWYASASVDPDNPEPELDRVRAAAARAGLAADIVVSNDVVPLLWGVPTLAGVGVVVVCGTGSGFLGADAHGRVARAGGCEYLGSDEGGASDLGWHGLRAAVRATDGRGPATALVAALGGEPADLAREIAAEPFPKQHLADLAPAVCATWLAGDRVAGRIVDHAVDELVTGVRAVRDRLGLDRFAVAAAGGVLTGTPALHRKLAGRLRAQLDVHEVELVADTAATVLAGLPRLLDRGTPHGRHTWLLTAHEISGREHAAGTVPGRLR